MSDSFKPTIYSLFLSLPLVFITSAPLYTVLSPNVYKPSSAVVSIASIASNPLSPDDFLLKSALSKPAASNTSCVGISLFLSVILNKLSDLLIAISLRSKFLPFSITTPFLGAPVSTSSAFSSSVSVTSDDGSSKSLKSMSSGSISILTSPSYCSSSSVLPGTRVSVSISSISRSGRISLTLTS